MDKEAVRFVDANIFLEVLLNDKRLEEAKRFLERLSRGELFGATSDFIVFSILLEINNKTKSREMMRDFITFIGNVEGLKVAHFTPSILLSAILFMEKHNLDFDDSLQLAFMEALNIKEIVSFDGDFDGITGIKRVEPVNIL